jgi:hypothetical protein
LKKSAAFVLKRPMVDVETIKLKNKNAEVNNGIIFSVRAINGRGYQVFRVASLKPDMVSRWDRRRHLIDSLFVSSTGLRGRKKATCTCGISLALKRGLIRADIFQEVHGRERTTALQIIFVRGCRCQIWKRAH